MEVLKQKFVKKKMRVPYVLPAGTFVNEIKTIYSGLDQRTKNENF